MVDIWKMAGAPEIQDGGQQTGTDHISARRLDSGEIPTAIPIFAWSHKSMKLLPTTNNVTGSGKSIMAAAKPEIATSQPIGNTTATPIFSWFPNSMKLLVISRNVI